MSKVYFSTEPEIPVVGGPMMQGYSLCLDGQISKGRRVICDFLAAVYKTRRDENMTTFCINSICDHYGIPRPDREEADIDLIRQAVEMRFDTYHFPLFKSISRVGYKPETYCSEAITMKAVAGKHYVYDGKNRCSILAAMGKKRVSYVALS